MARMRWTRQSAIEYLAERKLLTKAPEDYKDTAYLKRIASSFKRQEEKGEEPSRKKARGHQSPPIEHLERNKEKHLLDQYRIMRPGFTNLTPDDIRNMDKRAFNALIESHDDLERNDLKKLYNRTPKHARLMLGIVGIGQDSETLEYEEKELTVYDPKDVHTYNKRFPREAIGAWLKDKNSGDILDFANRTFKLTWKLVLGVIFSYPESMKDE